MQAVGAKVREATERVCVEIIAVKGSIEFPIA